MGDANQAYRAAAELAKRTLERERPDDARLIEEARTVVVRGQYDRGEQVFGLCGIASREIDPAGVSRAELSPEQVLFVNCPGQLPPKAIERVKGFVEEGGLLVTTDWALQNVIEKAFPGTIAYDGAATRDDVVHVVFHQVNDTFLEGLVEPGDEPLWWLEGSSYPIQVLDRARVQVLASSDEMAKKYRHSPIVVCFEAGKGKVYHMTSHFFLQRAETRGQRGAAKAEKFAKQKGVAAADLAAVAGELAACNVAEVTAAYTSVRSVQNLVVEQGRRVKGKKKGA